MNVLSADSNYNRDVTMPFQGYAYGNEPDGNSRHIFGITLLSYFTTSFAFIFARCRQRPTRRLSSDRSGTGKVDNAELSKYGDPSLCYISCSKFDHLHNACQVRDKV